MSKHISILGSTGSIGKNTLHVIDNLHPKMDVVYLSVQKNTDELLNQVKKYHPKGVAVADKNSALNVQSALKNMGVELFAGREGLLEVAGQADADIVMNGLVGSAGMEPTLEAIQAGVDVALSNKESLVMAGSIIEAAKKTSGASIFPVDSEHSAIWQCLVGENMDDVKKIILTGSGGPFRTRDVNTFHNITPQEALNHPNWAMGNKITIDSATMMNKGLEVIEAQWLFDMTAEQIEIIVHPQSIIHSMVEFSDGSVKAQLGVPDMKIPIQYALTYPRHAKSNWENLDLISIGQLTFEAPDFDRFPCIKLAMDAMDWGGSTPAVLNVANEQAVYRYISGKIAFTDIPKIIEKACGQHHWMAEPTLDDLLNLELWTTEFVASYGLDS